MSGEHLAMLDSAAPDEDHAARQAALFESVTHDLRNPLGSVLVHAALIVKGCERPDGATKVKRWAEAIHRSATRLNGMLEDLLELADWQSGEPTLARRRHDAATLLEDVLRALDPHAAGRGVAVSSSARGQLLCDAERLGQALVRLGMNSIDHAPEGSLVELRGERAGDRYVLTIRDAGETPPDHVARAFSPARRPGMSSRAVGLGPAIARHVVLAHGGHVSLESLPGSGTLVRLELPVT